MRDLLFRNLTSLDRKRKILASSEIFDKSGVRTVVRRHFVYIVKEVPAQQEITRQPAYLFVLKVRNTKVRTEKFFCRMKGCVYAVSNNRVYVITFMHSLKICLTAIPEDLMKYT
jgi:hypothetical protein